MYTKACSLTENEIEQLIFYHGDNLRIDPDHGIERINYLNKRLKAYNETKPEETKSDANIATNVKDGW